MVSVLYTPNPVGHSVGHLCMDLGEKTCTVLNSFLGLSHGLSMGYYSP